MSQVPFSTWQDLAPGQPVTIIKRRSDVLKPDTVYTARMVESYRSGWYAFEAAWTLPYVDAGGIIFEPGGRLVEYFSPMHWYNIFAVYRSNGAYAGLYANVTAPPTLEHDRERGWTVIWPDLWLDVIKLPDGTVAVLDEDEFDESGISVADPELARLIENTCDELKTLLATTVW